MDKKSVAEIRKLLKANDSRIDRIRGCYVSEEGKVICELQDGLGTMPEESLEKYCEIFRKTLTGKLGRSLFNMEFPLEAEGDGTAHDLLCRIQESELKDEALLQEFYAHIIDGYKCQGKFVILLVHGAYDIPAKTTDNLELDDASDYVYSFILCSICPVTLMKEGLCYDSEAGTFLNRLSDWAIGKPETGFLFPTFNDRMPDIHSLLYFARKPDELHEEISSDFFRLRQPMPEADQKAIFKNMVEQTLGRNCDFENVKHINDAVNDLIEQQKDSPEPVQIEKVQMRRLLSDNGAQPSVLENFDAAYDEAVGEGGALTAENIADTAKLEVKSPHMKITVDADMTDMIRTKVIDGMEYLIIPVADEIEVNGIRILQSRRDGEES